MMNFDFIEKIILACKNKMSSKVDKRFGGKGTGFIFKNIWVN